MPGFRVRLDGPYPDALRLTLDETFYTEEQRYFYFRAEYDEAVAGQEVRFTATSDSPLGLTFGPATVYLAGPNGEIPD